jgi:hypothetical protein
LFAEINLLGNERLRVSIREGLIKMFVNEVYEPVLKDSGRELG